MGCSNSKKVDDREPLISLNDINSNELPLLSVLNLVIIGSQCSGKNTVGNVLLGYHAFNFWTRFTCRHIKKTGKVFDRTVELVHVPGWTGNLSPNVDKQRKTKQHLVHSVQSYFKTGPHAVLLVLNVSATITDTTRQTLESLFSEEIWDHTVVIFTHGEKLHDINIKDQIKVNHLDELIEKCGKRYYVVCNSMSEKQTRELIETLEYFIVDKDAPILYSSDKEKGKDIDLKEKESLIQRLQNKIRLLKEFKTQLSQKGSCRKYQSLIDSKDAEIIRLQNILRKRDEDVRRLTYELAQSQNTTVLNFFKCVECMKKDEEISRLREELSMLKAVERQRPDRGQHSELKTVHQTQMFTGNSSEPKEMPLSSVHHKLCSDRLREWPITLSHILDDLSDAQFKKLKDLIRLKEEWRIPESLLDGTDRNALALRLIQTWGEEQCVMNIKNIMKEIPRNDNSMKSLIMPHLEAVGESW